MQSMANLKFALAMRSRSAKLQMALMYASFRSTSSMGADVGAFAGGASLSSASMALMIAGVADPPNFPLNFTPFQFQGLWLEVITTPPAAPVLLTAKEIAGVGVESLAILTG